MVFLPDATDFVTSQFLFQFQILTQMMNDNTYVFGDARYTDFLHCQRCRAAIKTHVHCGVSLWENLNALVPLFCSFYALKTMNFINTFHSSLVNLTTANSNIKLSNFIPGFLVTFLLFCKTEELRTSDIYFVGCSLP